MHVVIVGGGFGGIKTALELSKRHVGKITLISEQPYFLHHATLYATATGKSTEESVIPMVDLLEDHPSIEFIEDSVKSFDPHRKLVTGKRKDYHYDKLVLSLGSTTRFFGIEGMEAHAYGVKTLAEVRAFQDHIHEEVVHKKLDKEYFVIGGGLTGVETAAALQEHLEALKSLYRLPHARPKVTLVEAAYRIVPQLSKTAAKKITRHLEKQGIKVLTDHKVSQLTGNNITIGGRVYPTKTAIWTSGTSPNPFYKKRANAEYFSLSDDGRVKVNPYLEALDHVYVIGDNNNVKYSGMALPAFRQATHVAKNITRLASGRPQHPFRPTSSPVSVPAGSRWGYVEWAGIYQSGLLGHQFRRWMVLYGYTRLMPFKKALPIWRSHDVKDVDDYF